MSIINAETLSAEITCTVPASITEFPVFKVDLSDTKGHTFTKYYAYFGCDSEYRDKINAEANGINNVDYLSMKRSARTFRLSLALDDLSTDTASVEHCQVFLTSNDISGKSNENVWISGKTAGGLIGVFGKNNTDVLSVKNCSASTVVGNFSLNVTKTAVDVFETESAGGLIGKLEMGNAELLESYADCYLVGKIAGGLIGSSAGNVDLSYCYSAGFLTYEQKGEGFVCGSASMGSSYTVVH